jgi:ribosome-associated toxin RatA of RatAB toxin-antitoxin module
MIFVWMALGVVGAVVVFFVVMTRIGKGIPEEHTATSVIRIGASAAQVFEAIADVASHPAWAKGVTGVEMLPEKDGRQMARMRQGRNAFVLMRTRCEPPPPHGLLERTISDDHKHFSGTWLYRVMPAASALPGREGCEVKLTETGRVNMPLARAMMKHVFGYHLYTNKHLESLAAKFGTRARARKG